VYGSGPATEHQHWGARELREITRAVSCGALKGATTGIRGGEGQKTGVLDLVGTVQYPPSYYAVCKEVSPEKNCDHINHLEQMGSLLHSLREQISSSHDQFERTVKMSTIQGQMGSLLHSWSK
jgi:hypothetical protein